VKRVNVRLAEFIRENRDAIVKEWESFAASLLPAARKMTSSDLRDHVEQMLDAIVSQMQPEQDERSTSTSHVRATVQQHADERATAGFTVEQIVSEYRALRASVLRLWEQANVRPDSDLSQFNDIIDHALCEAADEHTQQQKALEAARAELEAARSQLERALSEERAVRERAEKSERDLAAALEETRLARNEAEASSRAKDDFLAMLGHELRNPLAPIMSAVELLKLRGVHEAERERTIIERQATQLHHLVDDLLDVTRIIRGSFELDKQRIDLSEIVNDAVEMLYPAVRSREQNLEIRVPTGLEIDVDPARISQVLSNVLSNAAKYTHRGGKITVTAARERDLVVLKVCDNGVGIDAELLPNVFKPFVQGLQRLDRETGGLGLGLSIVHGLVTMHGGFVELTSPGRNRGTEVTIRLPAAAPTAIRNGNTMPLDTTARPLRVLVVDDNEDAAAMIMDAMVALGHVARVAHDGASAVNTAKDFVPDVALIDLGLPVFDGYEVARRLRRDPSLQRTRLVALTGYGLQSDRNSSVAAGFDAHLVKPVRLAEIASILRDSAPSSIQPVGL
jgi:signal transduction histidine kinase/ActR/RegA family two-component response regulator